MFRKVRTSKLAPESLLHGYVRQGDFLDCFTTSSPMTAREAAEIITNFPGWVQSLLTIRSLMTSPFGLSQDGPDADDKLGPFPVEHTGDTEVIAGFNDRHLDFRVSVLAKDRQISLATWVHPHNLGGKGYLAAIKPFHILVAHDALARVANTQSPALV